MKVTFKYFAQIRKLAGTEIDTVEVEEGTTAAAALQSIEHGEGFHSILFDESGSLRPVIMLIADGIPIDPDSVLSDGVQIQLFSPVAGG
jgi:molybdopterin converting factor small subunit